MELGQSGFLSVVFLGLVVLYIATMDRWNWKKIILLVIGIPVVIGLGFVAWVWVGMELDKRPVIHNELWSIKLGMPKSEVKYLKGKPSKIDGKSWTYDVTEDDLSNTYRIIFEKEKVSRIDSFSSLLPPAFGVNYYEGEKSIRERFGEPDKEEINKASTSKLLVFKKYQVWFGLSKDRVEAFGVMTPSKEVVFTDR